MQNTHFKALIEETAKKINDLEMPYIERAKYDDWLLIDDTAH